MPKKYTVSTGRPLNIEVFAADEPRTYQRVQFTTKRLKPDSSSVSLP